MTRTQPTLDPLEPRRLFSSWAIVVNSNFSGTPNCPPPANNTGGSTLDIHVGGNSGLTIGYHSGGGKGASDGGDGTSNPADNLAKYNQFTPLPNGAYVSLNFAQLRIVGTNGNDDVRVWRRLATPTTPADAIPLRIEINGKAVDVNLPTFFSKRQISIEARNGDDRVDLAPVTTDMVAYDLPTTIYGGNGNDTLLGGAAADSIQGGNGNDTLDGRGGSDKLLGNAGDDHFLSSKDGAKDFLYGHAGNDTLDEKDPKDLTSAIEVLPT